MKRIEAVEPEITDQTREAIADFWTRNVNAERIFGANVTQSGRGEDQYFHDLETQRYRSHRHLIPWIGEMEPGRSVLEIGCGVGLDSYQMAKRGLDVTAIDLTQVAIDTARKRFERQGLKARFQVGDALNLDFPDGTFDYVYSFGVLHHTQDTARSIREAWRVLKPGGTAKIMLYHRHSLNELVHRITGVPFEDKDELCPVVRRFTVAEVRAMFSSFRDVRVRKDFVYGEGYGPVFRWTPAPIYRLLSQALGWHLMITAVK